jgi:SpoVK/Ycf46/Vps4 family AAA+-type ATPase
MDGLHKDEAVLVVGSTNRLRSVDPAFLRPGRFGELVKVDYPEKGDRIAILSQYSEQFNIGLTDEAINHLAELTNENDLTQQDSDNSTSKRFSGDHLRAICLFLLRESLYRREHERDKVSDVNDKGFLKDAVVNIQSRETTLFKAKRDDTQPDEEYDGKNRF